MRVVPVVINILGWLRFALGTLYITRQGSGSLRKIYLDEPLLDKHELEGWLQRWGLIMDPSVIDFSQATLLDLTFFPLVFYKEYATPEQLEQIYNVHNLRHTKNAHLREIWREAKMEAAPDQYLGAINIPGPKKFRNRRRVLSPVSDSPGSNFPSSTFTFDGDHDKFNIFTESWSPGSHL